MRIVRGVRVRIADGAAHALGDDAHDVAAIAIASTRIGGDASGRRSAWASDAPATMYASTRAIDSAR